LNPNAHRAKLRAQLVDARSKLDLVTLRAPVSGTVIDLQAQTFARDSDIAFIRPSQSAEIALTSYDKSLYGTLPATVTLVSQDAPVTRAPLRLPPLPDHPRSQQPNAAGRRKALRAAARHGPYAQIKLQKLTSLQLQFSRMTRTSDAIRRMR